MLRYKIIAIFFVIFTLCSASYAQLHEQKNPLGRIGINGIMEKYTTTPNSTLTGIDVQNLKKQIKQEKSTKKSLGQQKNNELETKITELKNQQKEKLEKLKAKKAADEKAEKKAIKLQKAKQKLEAQELAEKENLEKQKLNEQKAKSLELEKQKLNEQKAEKIELEKQQKAKQKLELQEFTEQQKAEKQKLNELKAKSIEFEKQQKVKQRQEAQRIVQQEKAEKQAKAEQKNNTKEDLQKQAAKKNVFKLPGMVTFVKKADKEQPAQTELSVEDVSDKDTSKELKDKNKGKKAKAKENNKNGKQEQPNASANKNNAENKQIKDEETKRIVQEISKELEVERPKMLEDLSTLWVSAVQKSDTVSFAIMKLSNPNGEEVNKRGYKKILEPILGAAPLIGQTIMNPTFTAGSIIGSNVLGSVMNDNAEKRLTKVNDADLVILAKAVDDLQERLVGTYFSYISAFKEYEYATNVANARQKHYEKLNKVNSPDTILASTFYTEALDNLYKARQNFLLKRVALEQMVGTEALTEIEKKLIDVKDKDKN